MQEFRRLSDKHRKLQQEQMSQGEGQPRSNFWFSDSTATLFLLVHDVHNGSEAKAQEVLANLKITFGDTSKFMKFVCFFHNFRENNYSGVNYHYSLQGGNYNTSQVAPYSTKHFFFGRAMGV